jgi:hypothetical protein
VALFLFVVRSDAFSEEVRVMLRPFRAYRALAEEGWPARPAPVAITRPLLTLFVIGAFVSLTSMGRLVPSQVVLTMGFWAFAPLLQIAALALALRAARARVSFPRAVALYFAGHGPWLLFLLSIAGVCLLSPNVYATMMGLLQSGALPALLVVIAAWSAVLTWASFRAGMGLSRSRAALATAVFYGAYAGAIVGYYLATNQIQPQLAVALPACGGVPA